jgi:2-oxoglutarate dehydrogenase E1 component
MDLYSRGYNDVRISGRRRAWNFFTPSRCSKVEESEEEVTLIDSLEGSKGKFNIYNSLLSEYGVLGFDYGYALANKYLNDLGSTI